MRIFRVENAEGIGAYHAGLTKHPIESRHPEPSDDNTISDVWWDLWMAGKQSDYFFGFAALPDLQAWFHDPTWLRYAHENGLAIHVYEIDEHAPNPSAPECKCAYVGEIQTIFLRSRARHLYSTPLYQPCAA